jgi:hypothetical protein
MQRPHSGCCLGQEILRREQASQANLSFCFLTAGVGGGGAWVSMLCIGDDDMIACRLFDQEWFEVIQSPMVLVYDL